MARKNDLKVALLLDLDNFATGLKDAKTQARSGASAITQTLDDMASKVAARVLSVQTAMHVAKKAFEGFIHTAEELEKNGGGNDGTQAVARTAAALGALEEGVVKAITSTNAFAASAGALADVLEIAAFSVKSWDSAMELADISINAMVGSIGVLMDEAGDSIVRAVNDAGKAVARFLDIDLRGKDVVAPNTAMGGGEQLLRDSQKRFAALREKADADREAMKAAADAKASSGQYNSEGQVYDKGFLREIEGMRAEEELKKQAAEARLAGAAGGVVDSFVNSWEGGFARLGDLFHRFSDQLKDTLGGLKESTVQALGDTFDSVAFLGPMLQKVYGQSAEGARRFQAAQLALVGALAVVKSAMAFADASDLLADDPGGAAAKLVAAAGYAAAATLAGVATARTLSGGGSSPASGGIASSEQFGQQRQNVTVVIQNSVGGMEFVEREVLPALNRLVKADHVLLATSSQSADGLQPGRFQS